MKRILAVITALVAVLSCSDKQTAGPAVLIGDINGDFTDAYVIAYPMSSFVDYPEMDIQNGHFEVTFDDVDDFIDLVTIIDDEVFGARINAQDTVRLTFTGQEEGHFDVIYDGANEPEGRIWADWYSTYGDISQYNLQPERDPDMTFEQSMRLLDVKDSTFMAGHTGQLSPYHIRRAELERDFIKAVLMEYRAYDEGSDHWDCPEYVALVKDLDPNDPFLLGNGMLARWAGYAQTSLGDDEITRNIRFFKEYKDIIKDDKVKRFLLNNISFTLRNQPELFDESTCAEYLEAMEEFCPDCPEIIENCSNAYASYKATRPGADMPDVELIATDGSRSLLSSLFGKVLYIDMWATWCGPCIRETPYMAALAERMKGRDDIVCISISTDETDEPWQSHLAKEQPDWPQYRADPESCESFSKRLNISGIPRFIIVGKDGRIYDPDAIRPSNEDIDDVLLTAAAE